ncbi:Pyocin activator protein PrtN [Ensifer sp. MPMI2T]|nr:Pyocin activator protein PrtN [Ensifer sp. MPMI2T]
MNTAFLLMAQYSGKAVIPLADVCRDYFSHLTVEIFLRKVAKGEIKIPVVRIDDSQKAAKGIHLQDLANYLDARKADAAEELRQLTRA